MELMPLSPRPLRGFNFTNGLPLRHPCQSIPEMMSHVARGQILQVLDKDSETGLPCSKNTCRRRKWEQPGVCRKLEQPGVFPNTLKRPSCGRLSATPSVWTCPSISTLAVRALQELPALWSRTPSIPLLSYTSSMPQDDMGDCVGLHLTSEATHPEAAAESRAALLCLSYESLKLIAKPRLQRFWGCC